MLLYTFHHSPIGHMLILCLIVSSMVLQSPAVAQLHDGTVFRRTSRASNFEFEVQNNGMLFGDYSLENQTIAHWPRGSFHLWGALMGKGLVFLANRNGRLLASEDGFMRSWASQLHYGLFDQMVPGRIGDPRAGFDPVFNGAGWRYVDDPDYIVYSSLDYDSTGVDISGNNFNDWPIRIVHGIKHYVTSPLDRRLYPPAFTSDEDMFCVFKDTDTRADVNYTGPNGPSIPIGIEIHNYIYTWRTGPGKDIALLRYVVINKSGVLLDSCFVVFATGTYFTGSAPGLLPGLRHRSSLYIQERWRDLTYVRPTGGDQPPYTWTATPIPPTIGFPLLESPRGYSGEALGLTFQTPWDSLMDYQDAAGHYSKLVYSQSDSIVYRSLTRPHRPEYNPGPDYFQFPVLVTGPFPLAAGDTTRFTVGFIFSDSLKHLLLMDDFIRRVWNNNFQRPSPPSLPRLSVTGLNRAIKLSWDNTAESSTDPIISDSLGAPFRGYRLLRAQSQDSPFVQIGRWVSDTLLVHEYLDRGEDSGGLKNNVRYYYRLLAFDAGAKLLKLDPMESKAVDGVNAASAVPTTEPANATSSPSDGTLLWGTLGDVSVPRLIPLSPTNFNNLLSGRSFLMTLNAATDGIRYTLPLTIRDTIAGRVHNTIIDPNLAVNGTPQTAGVKQGTALVNNIFGIDAANVTFTYRFEQLADSFHMVPTIEGQADVPIIINDSLNVTGINISAYTTAARELLVEFTPGGIDTLSTIFQRYFPYLNLQVRDGATGTLLQPGVDYGWTGRGIKTTGSISVTLRSFRYYLSDTLSNGEQWDCGHLFSVYQSKIAFDFADHGVGSGKPSPTFSWASTHRVGTREFQAGDRVRTKWQGGVRATFPRDAQLLLQGSPPGRTDVTNEMMERIRIVPNPYMVRHEAQRGQPVLYFNYLPEECTIRIYTVALDLVKTIEHHGGSREEWDLTTTGGQLVASQLLVANIEAPNGKAATKKFAVVIGK